MFRVPYASDWACTLWYSFKSTFLVIIWPSEKLRNLCDLSRKKDIVLSNYARVRATIQWRFRLLDIFHYINPQNPKNIIFSLIGYNKECIISIQSNLLKLLQRQNEIYCAIMSHTFGHCCLQCSTNLCSSKRDCKYSHKHNLNSFKYL